MGRSYSSHARPPATQKKLFYGKLQQGKHSHGGQKERFYDTLKTTLKAFNINPDTWEQTAVDGARWRYSIHKGANLGEERRTAAAQQKRRARKARASKQEQVSDSSCPSCHRTFRARIGLISHLRTHKSSQPTPTLSQPQDDWSGSRRLDGRTTTVRNFTCQSWVTMNDVWTQFSR